MILSSSLLLSSILLCCSLIEDGLSHVLKRQPSNVPSFVRDYAPLVWLSSSESYFPSDISGHLSHVRARVGYQEVAGAPDPLQLDNLDQLNAYGGANVFLTSVDDVTRNPLWLTGMKPNGDGKTEEAVSSAVIINDHRDGTIDVFYMYFYSYNLGNKVFGKNRGNHVGDWEYVMVRFQEEKPTALWFSQHTYGQAFAYSAVEKSGTRPIAYSAAGTHATYATGGKHDHTIPGLNLPNGPLVDNCDKGTLWDPLLNAFLFDFSRESKSFAAYDNAVPINWLHFTGRWGDQRYPDSDRRQGEIFGIDATALYTDGPTGPQDKQLDRVGVCPDQDGLFCFVRPVLTI